MEKIRSINTLTACGVYFILTCIIIYQYLISPLLGRQCRFYPNCSEYTKEAVVQNGIVKGIWLALKRLSRCHPWAEAGNDPVPRKQA